MTPLRGRPESCLWTPTHSPPSRPAPAASPSASLAPSPSSPDGRRVLFLRTRGPEDPTTCLWLLDGREERLLAAPDAGIVAYSVDAAFGTVVFAVNGDLWTLELNTSAQSQRLATAGPVVDPRLDPTGRRAAYVTGRSLRVVDVAGGNDRVVAFDDDPEVSWGLAEHVASESMHRTRGHWWSPDGTHLLAARVDQSPVQRWWIADAANPASPPREIAYPAAGTPNALVSLHAFDLTGSSVELQWDSTAYEYLAAVSWDSHGPLLAVQSRDQRTLQVLAADPATGQTRLLHEQRDAAWVELIPGTPARTASGKLVHPEDAAETRHLTVDGQRGHPRRPTTPRSPRRSGRVSPVPRQRRPHRLPPLAVRRGRPAPAKRWPRLVRRPPCRQHPPTEQQHRDWPHLRSTPPWPAGPADHLACSQALRHPADHLAASRRPPTPHSPPTPVLAPARLRQAPSTDGPVRRPRAWPS